MNLFNCIGLKEKDIVSIVGAGGKTTLMYKLAQDIKKNKEKVLITTTTKIYVPTQEKYDFICLGENGFLKYDQTNKKGIYVYGARVDIENKIIGMEEEQIDRIVRYFDYVFIEADGAKEKQIKGWNDNEPVIYSGTTKTIGVLDIQAGGMTICESNVHRLEKFCKITNSQVGQKITLEHLVNMCVNPQGLFKNAKGEKLLLINKADNTHYLKRAEELKYHLHSCGSNNITKIIIGSTMKNRYWV